MATDTQTGPGTHGYSDGLRGRVAKAANEHVVLTMMAPALLVILAIFIYPVTYMVYQSFFLAVPGVPLRFVGLDNYVEMLGSSSFWSYFGHTMFYSFGSLFLTVTGGLTIALAINHVQREYLRNTYSTVLMFSWAIPLAVAALIWNWILQGGEFGLLNMVLTDLGVLDTGYAWLADQTAALVVVTMVDAWARFPFAMIVFLAGLQSIPQHMYDAGDVDGATTFQAFRNITLPYLRPYFAIVGLITWMFAFRAFAVIYPMTQGGPGTATTTLSIYIYRQGMVNLQFGYASAVATFLVGITVIVAAFYVTVVLERIEE
ncbi:carbohydrate ABC transporter permease [Halobium salinum]|uniref:Carbohydrate ABC transporter permease n=1 Tax=Halobium salinum TaxID=1364940 RepID=A0ABD5PI85_9EURY|nr:sugar ABC transporter permease [Halobium salinum]